MNSEGGSLIFREKVKIISMSFWFQLANIHFMRKDSYRSLKWTNQILHNRMQSVRSDPQIHTRRFDLLIQNVINFFSKVSQTPKFEHRDRFKELQQFFFRMLFAAAS